ncbi:MAG: glycosyltransferase family 2 protein [Butyrivibrio sp.]
MKKILSVAVPCYNSQDYMDRCIDSLLVGGDEIEIIIVDDGSSDNTGAIADSYAEKYPTVCKAVHQENGGHGEAVNTGLANATGHFFKVVDSDDRVSRDALFKLLDIMRRSVAEKRRLDMLISNYVYDKQGEKRKKVIKYTSVLPTDTYFTWNDTGHFLQSQNILMHSVIYRTALLRECGLKLPAHTFYVDSIFVFQPLPYVKVMYYADVNFYWYFIGREDQSVHENVMINRYDQQILVNRILIDIYDEDKIKNKKCKKYMRNYLQIIMAVSTVLALISKDEDKIRKKDELWEYLKNKDERLYRKIRRAVISVGTNLPGKGGRKVAVAGYRVCKKIFKFN